MKLEIFRQTTWSNNDSRRGNQARAAATENEEQTGREGKSTPTKPTGKQHGNKSSQFPRQKATSAGLQQSTFWNGKARKYSDSEMNLRI